MTAGSSGPFLLPLRGPIKTYAWGSRTALAALLGRPPADGPEAELWLGAHADGSAEVLWESRWMSLRDAIARDPIAWLGRNSLERFGAELPFLLKVLAIERPLSLQAHPDHEAAARGFARERAAGLDESEHRYRDVRHKPELVVALEPLWALHGLLPPEEIRRRFDDTGVAGLAAETAALVHRGPSGLHDFVAALLGLEGERRRRVLAQARSAVERARRGAGEPTPDVVADGGRPSFRGAPPAAALAPPAHTDDHDAVLHWLGRVLDLHPNDPAALAPLFLRLVRLAPGEGLFQAAGVLHCYLHGCGIEAMASSDNVVRAGLTEKRVDVEEVLAVGRFDAAPAAITPPLRLRAGVTRWPCAAEEFELTRIEPSSGAALGVVVGDGLAIGLCIRGAGRLSASSSGEALALRPGAAFAVRSGAGGLRFEGDIDVFVAGGRGTVA